MCNIDMYPCYKGHLLAINLTAYYSASVLGNYRTENDGLIIETLIREECLNHFSAHFGLFKLFH